MNKYLPIGSVVLLKESNKRLMIYGVKQIAAETKKEYDYIACLFPEGNIDAEHTYLFNHDQIDRIFFIGMQDEEQMEFNKFVLDENTSK
ncbi:DUF4176 domain-containing protein [Clostridium neuense]|uniref:DUF4176 domain-containing protein n=1 Tax=Clostridium neuense TaxID=1728934 RepID=A0ABW8TC94_9CLOT